MFALLLPFRARADAPATRPATQQTTYVNPLPINVADPFVIRDHDLYWLYGTSARDGFLCWSSPDLVNWTERGHALQTSPARWGKHMFWAPCVIEHDGTFYMYYSCLGKVAGKDQLRICVATSDKPGGPFVDVKAPMLEIGKNVIDAHVFIDDDEQAYLYYALDYSENIAQDPFDNKEKNQSHLYAAKLARDLISVAGESTFCTKPDQKYEGDGWNEAPFVFRHGKAYVLMYSTHAFNDSHYNVCYATANSPLGPWKKAAENPILARTKDVSGPGHNCVIASPDGSELFCMYHVHKNKIPGGARLLAIDRMTVTDEADGSVKVKIDGPTSAPQKMPGSVSRATSP
jgi:beta-xylosidase